MACLPVETAYAKVCTDDSVTWHAGRIRITAKGISDGARRRVEMLGQRAVRAIASLK